MAKIGTTFSLIDHLTAPLQRIERQVARTKQMVDTTGAAFDQMGSPIADAEARQTRFNNALAEGNQSAGKMTNSLRNMAAAALGFATATNIIREFVQVSDEMTSAEARLAGIVDDVNTVESLSQKVYDSAQRSRGAYASTAQFVARVGQMAGDLFTNDELVRFAETLNKQMVINGTSTWEAEAAMTQLSQALGSGVLRGEELNSVFEQAPGVIRLISDYLGVEIGQIRDMAAEGMLTSEIVKNAVLSGADEIDAAFAEMPMTWAQTWQSFINQVAWALKPLSAEWSEFLNTAGVQEFISTLATGIGIAANLAVAILDAAQNSTVATVAFKVLAAVIGVSLVLAFSGLVKATILAESSMIGAALRSAAAFVAAHAPLIAFIAIFALIVAAAQAMGISFRDVMLDIAGHVTGSANVIRWAFQNAWEQVKTDTYNALQWMLGKITDFLNWVADKVNGSKLLNKIGISADYVDFTPNYKSYQWVSEQEAFERGYANGVYGMNKVFNTVNGAISSLKDFAGQAEAISGSSLQIGDIPTAEDIGVGAGSEEAADIADTKDASEQTAENTKILAEQVKKIGYSAELLTQIARGQAMQKIEQNIRLDISAPINGTNKSDADGFVQELVDQLEVQLKNSKRSLAGLGV